MSRLLRLYPATWRVRYEAEFRRLLEERPIGVGGTIDVVLGAIDAHLHPDLVGAEPQPWTHRLPGLLATTAGLIWTGFWIHALLTPEEWGDSIGWALLLMAVAVPGDYLAAYRRQIGVTVGAIVVAMFLGRTLPWSVADGLLNQLAGVFAWLLVAAGMMTLVGIRAGIGRGRRWALLALTLVVPATIGIPILGGFGPGDPGGRIAMLVTLLPYGVAWLLLGLRMAIRGSATLHDTSSSPGAPEVSAT